MDVRINEVQSRVETTDSASLLDPRVLREVVRHCVRAVKEELARDKRVKEELSLTSDDAQDR
jgi:hypothetical protein